MLETFYFQPYPPAGGRDLAIETYSCWREPRRGVVATGRFDRVSLRPDGVLDVIDYKTGAFVPDLEAVASNLQTVFYKTIAADKYRAVGATDIQVTFVYLAAPQVITVNPDVEFLKERWAEVEEVVAAIRRDRRYFERGLPLDEAFVPIRSARCGACPIRGHCAGREAALMEVTEGEDC
jgi:hypothetical protein